MAERLAQLPRARVEVERGMNGVGNRSWKVAGSRLGVSCSALLGPRQLRTKRHSLEISTASLERSISEWEISISGLEMSTFDSKIGISNLEMTASNLEIKISGLEMGTSELEIDISGLEMSVSGLEIGV